MVYVPDLQIFKYHGGPFDPGNRKVPLKAVGWLEHPQAFTVGTVVASVVPKLKLIVKQTRSAFSQYNFRGLKSCSFCMEAGVTVLGPIWSQENIFIRAWMKSTSHRVALLIMSKRIPIYLHPNS